MTAWVALLRGVNVGGITIRNAELAAMMSEDLGLGAVRTVLASGNVIFEADAGPGARAALKSSIEAGLRSRFGYDAWIVLVSRAEVQKTIAAFPFDAADGTRQPWVVFGSDESALDDLTAAAAGLDPEADPVVRGAGVLYWNPRKGTTTDTAFAKLLARRVYRATTTNRNLRTLEKIVAA